MSPKIQPVKINKPGLKLREKSPIHEKIIDKDTGRRKIDIKDYKFAVITTDYEDWPSNGTEITIFDKQELVKDIKQIKSRRKSKANFKKNTPVDILVLGPGEGAEVLFLKKQFEGVKNNIDTLGLTNYLSPEASALKRKDYSKSKVSPKNYFEHVNHLTIRNKYDYIYSSMGPGFHTDHPEIVILKVASLLKVGGFARIESNLAHPDIFKNNINKYLLTKHLEKNIDIKIEHNNYDYTTPVPQEILVTRLK